MKLRVGLFVRTDQATKGGGDLVQANGYIRAVQRLEVDARLINRQSELAGLDVLHVFNFDRPWDCLPLAVRAAAGGTTIVLSPITHPQEQVSRYRAERSFQAERMLAKVGLGGDFSERVKAVARALGSSNPAVLQTALQQGLGQSRHSLWKLVDGVQLLSNAEKDELLQQGLDFAGKVTALVRNGVDTDPAPRGLELPGVGEYIRRYPRFAVVGGRIEPRKNQIEVAKAALALGIPVIFAGQLNLRHRGYCRAFQRIVESDDRLYYAGGVSQSVFAALLQNSPLHISASLFEVSPLVDLEARAAGCRIVSPKASFGTEFLDEYAEICDSWSADSVRLAIQRSWQASEPAPAMKVPTWSDTAEPLMELYEAAHHRKNAGP